MDINVDHSDFISDSVPHTELELETCVARRHNWIAHTFADSKEIFTYNLQLQVLL